MNASISALNDSQVVAVAAEGAAAAATAAGARDTGEWGHPAAAAAVREVLQHNKDERHIRGGMATHRKYKGI